MKRLFILSLLLLCISVTQAQLIQHLDAEIRESIVMDAENLVSEWIDQSGAGHNALADTDSVYYISNDGGENAWLNFGDSANTLQLFSAEGSDAWLDQSSGSGGFCVMLAFKVNGFTDNWNDLIGNSTAVSQGFGLRYGDHGNIQAYLGGKTINKGGNDLSIGDIVVYAFNYNAATGSYEFWDSKNNSSASGTIAPQDFSLGSAVTLGAISGDSRFFIGWVGELKVFDNALTPAEFQSERDSMGMRWAGLEIPLALRWRVVPEDPRFPTEDLILSAISVSDEGFNNPLPSEPGNDDCTATFQEAIDLVGDQGGGTVFVPEGQYRLDGRLDIPGNVTLRGRWRALSESEPAIGTILKIYNGHGDEDGSPFLTIAGSSGVRDLTFWHPEQDPDNIAAYPFVISSAGGPITIENINLINAYKGVNMSSASMCFIDNIQGTALNTGFFADKSYAVSRFDKLIFGPEYWQWSGLQDTLSKQYESYMMASGTGIDIREMDGFHLTESKVRGMNIGLQFDVGVTGDNPHGDISGLDFRNCRVALKIISAKGIKIVNSYLEGSEAGLQNLYSGTIKANNCTFVSGSDAFQSITGGTLSLGSCIFDGKVHSGGKLKITGCEFIGSGTDVELSSYTSSALIYACKFSNGPDIINKAPSTASILIKNDVTDTRYQAAPILPPKDLSIARKPARNDLFNIADFGAVGNDGEDDSKAFGQAIDAANANNGGIVFVPFGTYDISGSYTLSPGVELRGISGSRHKSKDGDVQSMIQIRGNEGSPEGAAFINLGENCGIRGVTFYYPSQKAEMLVPETIIAYPFTVRGRGKDIYIADCMFANPYQGINFVNADNHLLENCFLGGLNKTIYVQNCDGGRVENFHLKPDFWRDLKMGDYPVTGTGTSQLKRYCGKYLHGIWLENSTNQLVFNIFNHASHQFLRVDNSTGLGFMIGGEQLQRGYRFSGSESFSLVLPIGNINNQGDGTGTSGIWTDESFTGAVNGWLCGVEGCPDKAFLIESGEVSTQQSLIGGPGGRGFVNLEVNSNGSLQLNAFTFDRQFAYNFDPGSQVSIKESHFDDIPNAFLYDSIVVLERNVFSNSYAVSDVNQNWVVNQGLALEESNIEIEDSEMFPPANTYDARVIKGARTMDGVYTIHAADKDFLNGNNSPLEVITYFLIDSDCKIDVYYNSVSGRKLGKSYSYSGQASPSYKTVKFTANDALFTGDEDIYIKITGDSPLLNYVSLSRKIDVMNLPPEWSADTVYFADAKADSLYDESIRIGTDIVDPENDALYFSKLSGPAWLNISTSGQLFGTPGNGDEGLNGFFVQASDGNGNKVNATLLINVQSITNSPVIQKENITVYPLPVQDELRVRGIDGTFKYQIYHTSGYKILEGQSDNNRIETDILNPGSYILKIEDVIKCIVKY